MMRSSIGSLAALVTLAATASAVEPRPATRPDLQRFWIQQQARAAAAGPAWTGIEFDTTARELVAKAQPDESFQTVDGATVDKVNQAYVWASAATPAGDVWFGTVSNTHCLVISMYLAPVLGAVPSPIETDSYVCEFGPTGFADFRPPFIYRYAGGQLWNRTSALDAAAQVLLAQTVGLRAAGTHGGVVLLGGPSLAGGMNLFAFDAAGGAFLEAANFPDYNEVRRFAVLGDELYMGVGVSRVGLAGGAIVRWSGSTASPLDFDPIEVATFAGEQVTELAVHDGRLAVGTWPVAGSGTAGVWISPSPGADGILQPTDGAYTRIWGAEEYEPDPVTRATYGIGGMASFDGYLFWGTMHVPLLAAAAHLNVYGGLYDGGSPDQLLELLLGTHRATSVFRAAEPGTAGEDIQMLYGMPELPVFVPDVEPYWTTAATGWFPLHGISGFGNLFNNYLWSMQVHQGRLWMGTMDWLYLLQDAGQTLLEAVLQSEGISLEELIAGLELDATVEDYLLCLGAAAEASTPVGADLYYFPDGERPGYPESLSGLDNYASYGVRTLLSSGGQLWAGTANPMNLLTDPADDRPEGGWELLRLSDLPFNTGVGTGVTAVDGETRVTFCGVEAAGYTRVVPLTVPCCGLLLPPPPGYVAPSQVWLVGTSAQITPCADGVARVCIPSPQDGSLLVQLVLPPDGSAPVWLPLASGSDGEMMCGALQLGAQEAAAALGYHGFLGVIAVLQPPPVVPVSPAAGGMLAVLLAAAGVIVLRRLT